MSSNRVAFTVMITDIADIISDSTSGITVMTTDIADIALCYVYVVYGHLFLTPHLSAFFQISVGSSQVPLSCLWDLSKSNSWVSENLNTHSVTNDDRRNVVNNSHQRGQSKTRK